MYGYVADYFHSDFKILKAVQDLWRSSKLPHAKLKDMQITRSSFLLNQEIQIRNQFFAILPPFWS